MHRITCADMNQQSRSPCVCGEFKSLSSQWLFDYPKLIRLKHFELSYYKSLELKEIDTCPIWSCIDTFSCKFTCYHLPRETVSTFLRIPVLTEMDISPLCSDILSALINALSQPVSENHLIENHRVAPIKTRVFSMHYSISMPKEQLANYTVEGSWT